jgi:chromosome segregation ATPase
VPPPQRRTTSDGPSLGEVVRRLEDIVARLDEMQRATAEREARFETIYVRADVFRAVQATDAVQMNGLEAEIHSLAKRFDATDARISTIEEQRKQERKQDLEAIGKIEDRRRQDRALVLTGLAFPIIILLLSAVLLTGRV